MEVNLEKISNALMVAASVLLILAYAFGSALLSLATVIVWISALVIRIKAKKGDKFVFVLYGVIVLFLFFSLIYTVVKPILS